MPRAARMVIQGEEPGVYHVMSRTCLDGFPYGDAEKDELLKIIKRFSKLFFVEILGYCLLDNHFHLVLRVFPEKTISDEEIKKRTRFHYGQDFDISKEQIPYYRNKLSSLAHYMKEIKQAFSVYYNRRYHRRGTLWAERFKSLIVENGETLINCLAYVDLNPVRAGIVEKPEEYRWSSIGYHVQRHNEDGFLSLDFGLKEFGVKDTDRLQHYRKFLYEKGGIVDLEKEREREFELNKFDRFQYRTRYFIDSGIIGSKEFVDRIYQQFKHYFTSIREKRPKAIKGLEGVYSLKRLSEVI